MYIIVVGGGETARYLASMSLENGHKVAIIEKDSDCAQKILQEFDVEVFQADIAKGGILEEADVDRADAIIATTKDDSANLMTMFLGKKHNVKNLVSMVIDREHKNMFEGLGVQVLTDPKRLIAGKLLSMLDEKK
ncbi:TrkA family potassium uptake protein [Oscillatoriales cyanobacterium LEGE 11467]|uniref:TrkA family potassium uptake protein n=1 Tax=Zarconia navalis LEGE 11467 TaxID=1828826 RepID=A0A928VWV9_9CYAN|nr:NAD-binding protein [Zarconia navalis]MBE9041794.1 TrkA family potassium uptake protein [Zarconia navalis LEGE 11467]